MLSIIGIGRLTKFIALVVVTIGIWLAGIIMFVPKLETAKKQYTEKQGESEDFRRNISKMEKVAKLMQVRGSEYQNITDKGVRDVQDRIQARRLIQDVKFAVEIPFLTYRISAEKEAAEPFINSQGYVLSQSELYFDMQAYTGKDIFMFIEELKRRFDGHLVLETVVIEKAAAGYDDNSMVARNASALAQSLVAPRLDAKLTFTWNSLVKSDAAIADDSGMVDF